MIIKFDGDYKFLSNFYPCSVKYDGVWYPSSEHAYQAAKTLNEEERIRVQQATSPSKAKKLGKLVTIRKDWDNVKLIIMTTILMSKFANPYLQLKLIQTNYEELIEGNTWNDTYWGSCRGNGENHLGKILMELRSFYKARI